jgi:SAM-dependent MidA family methyltransferase
MEGIVFSNELLDALPFHRLRVRDGKLREIFIGLDEQGEPREIENDPSLAIGDWRSAIPDSWEFENCPRAEEWIRDIASCLTRGYVITVDYGYTREEYVSKPRPNGTWRTYFQHTRTDDTLANIGEQDITADVDFTSFIAAGEAAGLETVLFTDQTHALLEIGRGVIEEITTRDAGKMSKDRNAIHQLLHPAMMGQRFRVLIQRKK